MRAFRPAASSRRCPGGSPPAAAAPAPLPPQPEVGVPGHPRRPPGQCHRRPIYDFRCRGGGQRRPTPRETKAACRSPERRRARSRRRSGAAAAGAARTQCPAPRQRRPRSAGGGAAGEPAARPRRRRPPLSPHTHPPSPTGRREPLADGPLDGDRRQPLPRAGRAPRRAERGRARRGCGAERRGV